MYAIIFSCQRTHSQWSTTAPSTALRRSTVLIIKQLQPSHLETSFKSLLCLPDTRNVFRLRTSQKAPRSQRRRAALCVWPLWRFTAIFAKLSSPSVPVTIKCCKRALVVIKNFRRTVALAWQQFWFKEKSTMVSSDSEVRLRDAGKNSWLWRTLKVIDNCSIPWTFCQLFNKQICT